MHGHTQAPLTPGRVALSGRWAFAEVIAPLPLAAAALLAVNDTWLKPTYPGIVTGKLSDVAIAFLLPLYCSAVLALVLPRLALRSRLTIGASLTILLFAALELSPAAAAGFCQANTWVAGWLGITGPCRMTLDPSDLLTLVFVPLACLHASARAAARGAAARSSPARH